MGSRLNAELGSLRSMGREIENREPLSTELPRLQSVFDEGEPQFRTLFEEFDRSRPRPTLSRPARQHSPSPVRSTRPRPKSPFLDLRALEHVSDYDTNLMCPICHVPFVDPVVLDCDHTFCTLCYEEFRNTPNNSEGLQCPTCRTPLLGSPKKASRLVRNMCNDIRVRCPNGDCQEIMARGMVELHTLRECLETLLDCPRDGCEKKTKRKHFVPDQCIHESHIECVCGKFIELGKGEWLKHKDEDCPNTGAFCTTCESRFSTKDYLNGINIHVCGHQDGNDTARCPGAEYGCLETVEPSDLDAHSKTCTFAILAPTIARQSAQIRSLTEQLSMSRDRHELHEANFTRVNNFIRDRIVPNIPRPRPPTESEADGDVEENVEEIHREHIPSHRDLLAAQLRSLSPSPSPEISSQQHLLALHEQLRSTVNDLDNHMARLNQTMIDLEARTSMQLLNETLRIKEELAHTNAALFSTRSQVGWLLNRERAGQVTRGREAGVNPHGANAQHTQSQTQQAQQSAGTSSQRPLASASAESPSPGQAAGSAGGAGGGSANVSPFMLPSRPFPRRLSGSQERGVKL